MAKNTGRGARIKPRPTTTWITDATVPGFVEAKKRGGMFGKRPPWWKRWMR